jgi:hypothetical protein
MPFDQGSMVVPDGAPVTLDASLYIAPKPTGAGYLMGVSGVAGTGVGGGGGIAPAYSTFDIRNFGPALDGVTDDSAAWQEAIDAAQVAGGGVVTWQEGGGSTSIAMNLLMHSGVGLLLGPSCILRLSAAAADDDFLIGNDDFTDGNADITIEGGTYDGNTPAFSYGDDISTFQFRKVARLRLSNLTVTGGPAEGAYMYLCTDALLSGVRAESCGVVDGVNSDGSGVHFDTCSRVRFSGLECTNNGFHGLFVRGCNEVRGDVIGTHNHIDGVRVYGSYAVDITYNATQNTGNGLYAAGDVGSANYACTFRGHAAENGNNNIVANLTYDCAFFGTAVDAGDQDVYFTEETDGLYFFGRARSVLNDGPSTNSINLSGLYVAEGDARLTDSRTPLPHGASHAIGNDPISVSSVTGTLGVTHGGTGLATLPSGALAYTPSADTLAALAAPALASVLTHTGTGGVPTWVAALTKALQHAQTAYLDTAANVWTGTQQFNSRVAVGTAPSTSIGLRVAGVGQTGVSQHSFDTDFTTGSDATTRGVGVFARVRTPNVAFTQARAAAVYAAATTRGAASTITEAVGVFIEALTAGTNGTAVWGLDCQGTATPSRFAGPLSVGHSASPGASLHVVGTTAGALNAAVRVGNQSATVGTATGVNFHAGASGVENIARVSAVLNASSTGDVVLSAQKVSGAGPLERIRAVGALECLFVANGTAIPVGNPTGGGYLVVVGGALKYKGSSGTVTNLAPA